MRLAPFLVLFLLLPLAPAAAAPPSSAPAPAWLRGDFWQYLVTDGAGKPVGNLTIKVVSEDTFRTGNTTVPVYTLSQRLQPWTPPANETNLSEQARWGPIYTIVLTTLIIEKRNLCVLRSNSTIRQVHYADVTEDNELLAYSPSDGRLRFPLSVGASWTAGFNLTRTHRYPFHVISESPGVSLSYDCRSYDVLPDGKEGFRISCPDDGTGQEVVSWWSPRYRSEVRREERNAAAGTARVYALQKYRSGAAPSIFSNPQTWLALVFAAAAVAMLLIAVYTFYRARHPAGEGRKPPKAPAPAPQAPAGARGGPPPGPAPPAGKGPGGIL